MRLMTKQYTPRDLREACAMPREDAVWIMEHCADVWEADRKRLEEAEKVRVAAQDVVDCMRANPPYVTEAVDILAAALAAGDCVAGEEKRRPDTWPPLTDEMVADCVLPPPEEKP